MKVYKMSLWEQLKIVLGVAIVMGIIAALLRYMLTSNPLYFIGIPVSVFVVWAYIILSSKKMEVELTNDGQMKIFNKGKLLYDYKLEEVKVSYHLSVKDDDVCCDLYVVDSSGGLEHIVLDEFTEAQVEDLLHEIGAIDPDCVMKVETIKK